MHRASTFFIILGLCCVTFCTAGPYQEPPRPQGWEARAVVLPPHSIGKEVVRRQAALAVEIQVPLRDYLPRGLEPTLWIGDQRIDARSRIVKVEGDVTVLGFLVEDPKLLREGAALAVQSGEDEKTRAAVPGGNLQLDRIKPADPEELRRFSLPQLREWLRHE